MIGPNECDIRIEYDVACASWVVIFGPITEWEGEPTGTYATQGRTLDEALDAAFDLLHGLVAMSRELGREIPEDFPLKAQARERFLEELAQYQPQSRSNEYVPAVFGGVVESDSMVLGPED